MKLKNILFIFFISGIFQYLSCDLNSLETFNYKDNKNNITDYENADKNETEEEPVKKDREDIKAPEVNERIWNIFIYMAADNNLESAALNDIYEMETSKINTDQVSIFILLDRSNSYSAANGNWAGTRLFKLKTGRDKNCKSMISQEIPCKELGLNEGSNIDLDMADNITLSTSLDFIRNKFPANNYGLIIWGHGTGWRNSNSKTLCKGFAYDDTFEAYMTLKQLRQGLEGSLNGEKLDFLGFDTCFGGELEVAYELKHLSKFMVGSEGLMEMYGWNYNDIFNNFENTLVKTAPALTQCIINSFAKEYESSFDASIVALDMSEVGQYFGAFNKVMKSMAKNITNKEIRDSVINKIFYDKKSGIKSFAYDEANSENDLYIDIDSLVNYLADTFDNNVEIEKNINLYNLARNKCVIDDWGSYDSDGGLGVYFSTLSVGNTLKGIYPDAYIKNKISYQIAFVQDSDGYVPTVDNSGSFLDKLFY